MLNKNQKKMLHHCLVPYFGYTIINTSMVLLSKNQSLQKGLILSYTAMFLSMLFYFIVCREMKW